MLALRDHIYILLTIFFTIYGQLSFKWRLAELGEFPIGFLDKLKFIILITFDPVIFSGYVAAFLASLAWMFALTKFDLNYAYPFMSLNFVLVMILSGWFLNEPVTIQRLIGMSFIVLGTIISSRS